MGKLSKIEWTDHTFNPWRGCTKVSPGCAHCYAETLSKRNPKLLGVWGKGQPRVLASDEMWRQPLKWNRDVWRLAECPCGWRGDLGKEQHRSTPAPGSDSQFIIHCPKCDTQGSCRGVRPRVFCASLADWLDDEVFIGWLSDLLHLVRLTPNLDWLLLTKRPQNFQRRVMEAAVHFRDSHESAKRETCQWLSDWAQWGKPPANVWMGTTVEDQTRAVERIPHLLRIPARVRFLSCEPLLGPVDLSRWLPGRGENGCTLCGFLDITNGHAAVCPEAGIHWVIAGGESGPGARPMHPDWARSLRDQCAATDVPFLFKQHGDWLCTYDQDLDDPDCRNVPEPSDDGHRTARFLNLAGGHGYHGERVCFVQKVGKKAAGRLLDGIEHSGFPRVESEVAA